MSERIKKINDLLRDEIGKILLKNLIIKEGVLVTVMGVSVSPTLEHATVKISVLPEIAAKEVMKNIKYQIYDIQQQLNKRLVMRPVPKIRFEIDTTEEHAGRIENLLQKIKEK